MSGLSAVVERRKYFLAAAIVFVVDQASKIAADRWLRPRGSVEIIPGLFDLSYSRNRGGLFGYFSTLEDPWRLVLLTVLPIVAIVVIAVFLVRTEESDRVTRTGLAAILGGASGNLLDRILRGEVVDFLDVYVSWTPVKTWLVDLFGTSHWPTFNVADSSIVIGAGLLLVDLVRPAHRRAVAEPTAEREAS
ncbi:MAG: signal peptidase II [Acidobacteriota bacterium]|nr:signal peptidase II [Acidobacteriota bacterium]